MEVIILGGTGYIGRAVTRKLIEVDKSVSITSVSRSGAGKEEDPHVTDVKADCVDADAILEVVPDRADIIIDLVGGMESPEQNIAPAKATAKVADRLDIPKIGFVGGALGSKSFIESKRKAVDILEQTGKDVIVVNPTLVYGDGRTDALAKTVPLMKFFGLFSKKLKPVKVDDVAAELVDGLMN